MLCCTDWLRSRTTRVLLLSDHIRTFSTVEPANAMEVSVSSSAHVVSLSWNILENREARFMDYVGSVYKHVHKIQ